jgi:hypothetical protein
MSISLKIVITLALMGALVAMSIGDVKADDSVYIKVSGDGPSELIVNTDNIVKELSLWEKTKHYSRQGLEATIDYSEKAWESTTKFFEDDENVAWASLTGGGVTMAVGGASAITTTSILGLVTVTTAPAWAPVAICAGGAIAVAGATALVVDNYVQ